MGAKFDGLARYLLCLVRLEVEVESVDESVELDLSVGEESASGSCGQSVNQQRVGTVEWSLSHRVKSGEVEIAKRNQLHINQYVLT